MTENDPRHGTYAGAVAHWLSGGRPCDACARAEGRYRKLRKLDVLNGKSRTVPAIGIVRRVRALQALGWSGPQIAASAGLPVNTLRAMQYHRAAVVRRGTAEAVVACYERLSMTRPDGRYANRQRLMAARKGWAPPLAWDDIDDPQEEPKGIERDRRRDVDPVVVDRILLGEWGLPATAAERVEVTRRWLIGGGTQRGLRMLTGWRVERYIEKGEAA